MHDSGETRRVRLLARLALLWAAVIVVRLVYLQVFSHDELKRRADRQQQNHQLVRPQRASILDRWGHPLAKSVAVDSVTVNPLRIPDPDVAARILGHILDLDEAALRAKIISSAKANRGFIWVKRKITNDESQRLRSLNLDWIEFRQENKRYYPNEEVAAHVVGTVGILRPEDAEESGTSGIELELNKELEGTPGEVQVFSDVKGRAFSSLVKSAAIPGKDVTLTIDSRVQYVAEQNLTAAATKSGARTGSVVVMHAKTGDILALANWPSFNPNEAPKGKEALVLRNNVGVTSPYEPGSVFKIVTLSCGIDTGSVRPATMINCGNGVLRLGSRVIHEAKHGYGLLSAADVLAKSSNIGAIQVAMRTGQDKLYEYVRKFGFGEETGIPLPSESRGRLRPFERWGKTSFASVAMGHEISVTAIQLAQACAVIANGGQLVRPRLVMKTQRPGEQAEIVPVNAPRRVIKGETAVEMRQMMEGVVLHGTGRGARLKGYTSGGKTGTAQIYDLSTHQYTHTYNGSFVGFAPVKDPAIVIVVTLNGTSGGSSGYGGAVAAPVFREVATAALRMLDVPKDLPDENGEIDNEPVDTDDLAIAGLDPTFGDELVSINPPGLAQGSDAPGQTLFVGPPNTPQVAVGPRVPDFSGKSMREVIEQASSSGVAVEFRGKGVARAQYPPAGAFLAAGEHVKIQFAR